MSALSQSSRKSSSSPAATAAAASSKVAAAAAAAAVAAVERRAVVGLSVAAIVVDRGRSSKRVQAALSRCIFAANHAHAAQAASEVEWNCKRFKRAQHQHRWRRQLPHWPRVPPRLPRLVCVMVAVLFDPLDALLDELADDCGSIAGAQDERV